MKRIKNILLLFTAIITLSIVNVKAEEIDNGLFQADDNLITVGDYEGTSFFAGETVTIESTTRGIAFAAANTLIVNGNSEYGLYAARNIDISGTIDKDLFAAASNINLKDKSNIIRDAYLAANSIIINNSKIGRNINLVTEKLYINNTIIYGNVNVSATSISFGDNVTIYGTLKYNKDATTTNIDKAAIGTIYTYNNDVEDDNIRSNSLLFDVKNFFVSLLGLFSLGIILYAIWPKLFKKYDEQIVNYDFNKGLADAGKGLLILILVPIISILIMLTIIGIPISIVTLILYSIVCYLSTLFVGYIIGNLLIEKVFNGKKNGYIAILLGVFLIKVIDLIPLLGNLSSLLVLCIGLTLTYKIIFSKK